MKILKSSALLTSALVLFLAVASVQAAVREVPISELKPKFRQTQSMLLISDVLKKYHYKKHVLDDAFSSLIFDEYLELIDPNKSYLTKEQVDTFRFNYAKLFDDDIRNGRLEPVFTIYKAFRAAVERQTAIALDLLKKPIDLTTDETYLIDRKDAPWPADQAALDALWVKRVKNDMLAMRLSKKDNDEALEQLTKRYEGVRRRARQSESDDVFLLFMSAYAGAIEPHTGYMLPRNAENFDISMRLSLQGIGAVLGVENEYTEVQKIIPGGPAEKSSLIHPGDMITGVAQGKDGEMIDVIGWRLQDVVDKIRGPKGTVVRLTILPKKSGSGGASKEITLVRDNIKLEEQAAKSSIIEGEKDLHGQKIGVIEIPAFYRDFAGASSGSKDFRSTTRDVRNLIEELQEKGVDGIVIDLRNNGGGSLIEATELTGLFIESGPVVQIRDYNGNVESEVDPDPAIAYRGPLVVMVNRNSASASEIFSGAIQDYGRGIIIGEPTFGKGTVQQLVELGNFLTKASDLGRMRVTIAQFFRVDGGSTQHRGVVPDIQFPTVVEVDYGERSLDNALPWASIERANHDEWGIGNIDVVRKRSDQRIKKDAGFKYLKAEAKMIHKILNQKVVSLNESKRKSEGNKRENERLRLHNNYRRSIGLDRLTKKEFLEDDDQLLEKRSEEEKLKEVELKESARILADVIQQELAPVIRSAQIVVKDKQDSPFQH
ncbi:C-terminal peptidase [Solemya velum gill symbiont]|uniref:C-terminal peptidase n=1 Tax=Solemya velum gill symbiont TaxID=2340 RepID=A0A0B0HCN5_SOVGS|nr:carboxy terminal-processing peptidase [Solemya velum gill symbiont]KHF25669.1 C-terminal peptidase [Solemya velum gill symbiont]